MPKLKRRLDEKDMEILRILVEDCNVKVKDVASRVGLSIPSVRARIRRLVKLGVLRGCRANVDQGKLGVITALLVVETRSPERILDVTGDNVEKLYYSTGREVAIAMVKVLSLTELERVATMIEGNLGSKVNVIVLDGILKESTWIPESSVPVVYKCDFCGAPITGRPYIVEWHGRILYFTNEKCAKAYFAIG